MHRKQCVNHSYLRELSEHRQAITARSVNHEIDAMRANLAKFDREIARLAPGEAKQHKIVKRNALQGKLEICYLQCANNTKLMFRYRA